MRGQIVNMMLITSTFAGLGATPADPSPTAYTQDGRLKFPDGYREWPDGTLLVKEARGATEKGSINQGGKFQSGEPMDIEAHVKDTHRFGGGWAFFAFGTGRAPVPQIPVAADCYSCHREHGWVDTTFVQFYPTLLSVAKQHGTAKAED